MELEFVVASIFVVLGRIFYLYSNSVRVLPAWKYPLFSDVSLCQWTYEVFAVAAVYCRPACCGELHWMLSVILTAHFLAFMLFRITMQIKMFILHYWNHFKADTFARY